MPKLPARTSYFTVDTSLTKDFNYRCSITLDILRQYYEKMVEQGEDINICAVDGFSAKISLKDLMLGSSLVFDELFAHDIPYSGYAGPASGKSHIGWNGPVTLIQTTVPLALKMYDEISSPSISIHDKNAKQETLVKWFHKDGISFFGEDSYDILQTTNPGFYNWIMSNVETILQMEEDYSEYRNLINLDATHTAKSLADLGTYGEVFLTKVGFYLKFLGSLESLLYATTKQIYPIKVYAIFGYLFQLYLKIIVYYIKPYRAGFIDIPPALSSSVENIICEDVMYKSITKQINENLIYRCFDLDTTGLPYDVLHPLQEFVHINIETIIP